MNWGRSHDKYAIFNNEISQTGSLSSILSRLRERRQTNRSASLTMMNEALLFLLDVLLQPFAAILLLRFHLQWLRAPLRNPIGEFIMALTDFLVLRARRFIPAVRGLDSATLLLALLVEMLYLAGALWAQGYLFHGFPLPGLVLLIWAAPRLARHVGGNGAAALWICVLNPLVIIHLMGGVHNEMLMVGLMMAGLALALNNRPAAGVAVIGAMAAGQLVMGGIGYARGFADWPIVFLFFTIWTASALCFRRAADVASSD